MQSRHTELVCCSCCCRCTAAESVSVLLRSNSHNLKYVGLDALGCIVKVSPKYAQEHQVCLQPVMQFEQGCSSCQLAYGVRCFDMTVSAMLLLRSSVTCLCCVN